MDYSKFISEVSSRRKPSGISEMRKFLKDAPPSLVWLASGMPNPDKFPIRKLTMTLEDGQELSLSPPVLAAGLQYGPTPGYLPLVAQLKAMVERLHHPPCWADSDLLVTTGAQQGICMALEMLLDPGDYVVVQDPSYSDTLCMLVAQAPQYVAVEPDHQGMRPDLLRDALKAIADKGLAHKLKALYVVPTACNPTGTTMGAQRRQDIYAIAQEYNLIILEDDPYYFLQYTDLQEKSPSFLSLDTDGRVLRFDSFSKIISAGLRVGYVSGSSTLLHHLTLHIQVSTICASMLSQVVISELLGHWGEEGFDRHLAGLVQFYQAQRDSLLEAAQTHLTGLCEWNKPDGGIFLWLKALHLRDTTAMLRERAAGKGIVLVPGRDFVVQDDKPCPYMRAAFSCSTPDMFMKGMENLASLIKDEMVLQDTEVSKQ